MTEIEHMPNIKDTYLQVGVGGRLQIKTEFEYRGVDYNVVLKLDDIDLEIRAHIAETCRVADGFQAYAEFGDEATRGDRTQDVG